MSLTCTTSGDAEVELAKRWPSDVHVAPADAARWLERNRRVLQRYQALVRTAVTLDALLDAEDGIAQEPS